MITCNQLILLLQKLNSNQGSPGSMGFHGVHKDGQLALFARHLQCDHALWWKSIFAL